jgi:hypothetical protein
MPGRELRTIRTVLGEWPVAWESTPRDFTV